MDSGLPVVNNEEASLLDETNGDDDVDGIVTMVDVLEQETEAESVANAVLGGADDKNCTYSQGYVHRQPLYACRTCCKDKSAGICLACSYKCHEGHDLVELYTKRNFRCDCGNSLFGQVKCVLEPEKDALNENNAYNQNFSGTYCTCHRPYPDPDDEDNDVMAQCIVCEDWFHTRHLVGEDLNLSSGGELLCHLCLEKFPFIALSEALVLNDGREVLGGPCKIAGVKADEVSLNAKVWPNDWRTKLCKCQSCLNLYSQHKVAFLLDDKDSAQAYESKNSDVQKESRYSQGMRALSSLDHVQQVEAIQSYNEMKTALMKRLQRFKDENKVVSESDIREFFDEIQAKRRRVMVPPTSCR